MAENWVELTVELSVAQMDGLLVAKKVDEWDEMMGAAKELKWVAQSVAQMDAMTVEQKDGLKAANLVEQLDDCLAEKLAGKSAQMTVVLTEWKKVDQWEQRSADKRAGR